MSMLDMMKNLPALMGQAKDMQERLREVRVTGESGGGMVTVEMNGLGEMTGLTLEPEVVDPEDREMLQVLIVAAAAAARKNVGAAAQEELGKLTGGLDLSGLMGSQPPTG